jgi:hypothetical protein
MWRVAALAATVPTLLAGLAAGPADAASKARFHVQGVVLSVHGNKVKVLSSSTKIGKKSSSTPKVVTLTLSHKTRKHLRAAPHVAAPAAGVSPAAVAAVAGAPLAPGQVLSATGTRHGGVFTVTGATAQVLPAQAMIGTVAAVGADGTTITVARHDHLDGDQDFGDNGELVLVNLKGAPVTGPAPAVGQYVVTLGESDDHVMLAAAVFTFADAPGLVAGRVLAADPTANSLMVAARGHEDDGDGQGGDGQGGDGNGGSSGSDIRAFDDGGDAPLPSVTVDTTAATVVVNGVTNVPGTPTYPVAGDRVLAVGATGATPDSLTATLVFAFNGGDDGSVQDNRHAGHDGHHGEDG